MNVEPATLERGAAGGLRPTDGGWYVVHADEMEHLGIPGHAYSAFEGDARWPQFGMGIDQLALGFGASYHRELHDDEAFLVLDGTCDLVIEGELHHLDAGTFVQCPAGTAHVFVGAGERPCRIFMFGARGHTPPDGVWGEYLPDDHAARMDVAVGAVTSDPKVAYAGRPDYAPVEPLTTFALDRSPRTVDTTHGDGTNGSAVLVDGPHGSRVPTTAGWFILHLDDALWVDNGGTASALLEGPGDDARFHQYGVNVRAARPGAPVCAYHREKHFDEAFLVLDGHGILIVEGEERPVRAGDVFWCPRGTAHVFVGAGDSPCVLLLMGTRDVPLEQSDPESLEYPVDDVAARHGASVTLATNDPDQAYADWPTSEPTATPPWRWRAS